MATYVISDLHGSKTEFDHMLKVIDFHAEYDEMWIVGDVCDRGRDSIPLLLEIMHCPSMHLIIGNHDVWLARYIPELIRGKSDEGTLYMPTMSDDFVTWLSYNGGLTTADQFMDLDYPTCYDIQNYLQEHKLYQFLEVGGTKYLLVHSGLGSWCRAGVNPAEVPEFELIWPHIGLEDNPYDDVTMIVGHMPTFLYGKEYDGKIIHGKKKSIFHIDCGCVYGRRLGCVRLEDQKEFYVPSTYPYLKVRT